MTALLKSRTVWYANAITIAANGNTTVGSLTVAGNTSGTFRFRKTATNTFTVYRVA